MADHIFHTNSRQTIQEGRRKKQSVCQFFAGGNNIEIIYSKKRKAGPKRVGQFFKNNAGSIETI